MGEVWRARDTRLRRDVAIKVLPDSLANDPVARMRFDREARAVAALSHPNILDIHDVGAENGVSWAVTELLEGQTLKARLDEGAASVETRRGDRPRARRGARGGALARDRPPRRQALERLPDVRRPREDPRLRHRHSRRLGGLLARRTRRHGAARHRRHRRVPLARAGPARDRRRAERHLRARLRPLRDGHGPARVPRRDAAGGSRRDAARRAPRSGRPRDGPPARAQAPDPPVPREEPGPPVPDGGRPRVRAEDPLHGLGDFAGVRFGDGRDRSHSPGGRIPPAAQVRLHRRRRSPLRRGPRRRGVVAVLPRQWTHPRPRRPPLQERDR